MSQSAASRCLAWPDSPPEFWNSPNPTMKRTLPWNGAGVFFNTAPVLRFFKKLVPSLLHGSVQNFVGAEDSLRMVSADDAWCSHLVEPLLPWAI
eukprot:2134105-Amphidinium_carterae.1